MNVDMIDTGSKVADIGCDHGFVSIYLIENNIAQRVLAMDVATGPLERAKEHVHEAGVEDNIDIRLSDGLSAVKVDENGVPEVDTVLIAGMGGRLAMHIVEEGIDKIRKMKALILQAQSDISYVRERLYQLQLYIVDENMVCEDGKYYTVIKAVPAHLYDGDKYEEYSLTELQYGRILINRKATVLKEYLNFCRSNYEGIVADINRHLANDSDCDNVSESTVNSKNRMEKSIFEIDRILANMG